MHFLQHLTLLNLNGQLEHRDFNKRNYYSSDTLFINQTSNPGRAVDK